MINNPRYLIYRRINLFAPVRNNIIMILLSVYMYIHALVYIRVEACHR